MEKNQNILMQRMPLLLLYATTIKLHPYSQLNQKALKVIETEDKFGVSYSLRDKGEIKRNAKSITRRGI